MARLREQYFKEIVPALKKEFGCDNVYQLPRLKKVVLNMGVGEALSDNKHMKTAVDELTWIAGQKAVITTAKKSIAGFKLREGQKVGAMVTLRGDRMYEFLDRLIYIALPRVRDFRGLPKTSFDSSGNYSFGIKEQIIFPEVAFKNVEVIRGLDVTLVLFCQKIEHSFGLLKALNFPFVA